MKEMLSACGRRNDCQKPLEFTTNEICKSILYLTRFLELHIRVILEIQCILTVMNFVK